ncbi:hypothetical protein BRPE64_ACDS26230 [Caballeronia insecticola]|uniref:Uncharacterized protein n=1 Tax=Caballeronia insecticola TaxID=758793 RepID=R4X0F2_9BURK|nr:hypothetical protein BRPE64_ACDS26230 [Caballeronia insecticola]
MAVATVINDDDIRHDVLESLGGSRRAPDDCGQSSKDNFRPTGANARFGPSR